MVKKPIYLAASLLAILSVVAIGASAINSVFAQSEYVQATIVPGASTMTDTAFSPNPIQAKVGQEVKWTNDDSAMHTITSGTGAADPEKGKAFDSGLSGPTALTAKGKTFEHKFDAAGEFPYFCSLHPAMVGKVTVS